MTWLFFLQVPIVYNLHLKFSLSMIFLSQTPILGVCISPNLKYRMTKPKPSAKEKDGFWIIKLMVLFKT
jgi:hypothetical protein